MPGPTSVAEWDPDALVARPMEGKTSKLSAGGPPWKWACWDVRSPFGLAPLRNSANPATCSLEVVAKMPQHIAKCQRGQGVWQAVKSLLKLAHRLEVKLWRQRKLALRFCLTLGWQKLKRCCHQVRKLRPHSPPAMFCFHHEEGPVKMWSHDCCSISREGNWLPT